MALPPGPRHHPTTQILKWVFRPGRFLEDCQQRYGDVFLLRISMGFSPPAVVIADPGVVKRLFREPSLSVGGEGRRSVAGVFGTGSIFLADGKEHTKQRKWLSMALRGSNHATTQNTVVRATDRVIDNWPVGRLFPVRPSLQVALLDVIIKMVFGRDEFQRHAEIARRVNALLSLVLTRSAFFALSLPERLQRGLSTTALDRHRNRLDEIILQEIETRIVSPDDESLLSMLLREAGAAGVDPTRDTLCDQIRMLLLAGHETTATSLAWTLGHLVQRPEALDRLTAEARGEESDSQYTDAVIQESMRLTPPVPGAQRKLLAPLEACGYSLPAGTLVGPSAFLVHRHKSLYPDPLAFRPERFIGTKGTKEAFLLIPFGGGDRRCPGASIARFQLNLMLRRICQRVQIRSQGGPEQVVRRGLMMAPAHGARVVLVDRRGA